MKNLAQVLLVLIVLASLLPFTGGTPERRSLDINLLTIHFDRADATFTVNYDLGTLPKMYVLLLGSKSIEPRLKSVFSNIDYEIVKMDQDKAILRVKNISRLEKGYYLHDSRKLGESVKSIDVYTPDSSEPKKYSNLYLFNWSNVPGSDNSLLIRFLVEDLNMSWAANAKITKTNDKTIRVFTGENSVEIALDKNNKKAIMKLSDGMNYALQVIEDGGKLFIYSPYRYSTPSIYYRS